MLHKNKNKNEDFVVEEQENEKEKIDKKKGSGSIKIAGVCCLLCVILFVALILIQESIVNQHKEQTLKVYTVACDLKQHTKIDESNVDTYFVTEDRAVSSLPNDAITDKKQLINKFVERDYAAKDVVTVVGIGLVGDASAGIEDPIEVSLGVTDLSQVVGGVIREGDRIIIDSVVSKESNTDANGVVSGEKSFECNNICNNAFVSRAFTSDGKEISVDAAIEEAAPTTIINVYIPKASHEDFNKAVAEGTIRVSRICE